MTYFLTALAIWLIGIPIAAIREYRKRPHLIPRGFYGWVMAIISYAWWPAPIISWFIATPARYVRDETGEAIELVILALLFAAVAVYWWGNL